MGLNASEIDTLAPKQEILEMVPEEAIRRYQAVPLKLSSGRLVVRYDRSIRRLCHQ